MKTEILESHTAGKGSGIGWLRISVIILLSTIVATLASVWIFKAYIFPSEFRPVSLNFSEQQILDAKLERLDTVHQNIGSQKESIDPEPYTEDPSSREIILTEKELNALLANNTDLAKKVAIDLSDGMASAKILIPLDKEFPVLGGKILKVSAGLRIDYLDDKPVIALKGVSVWGVPVPNAWLGNIKNIDLVKEFGAEEGFWKSFADGIERIEIKEKKLRVRLKE